VLPPAIGPVAEALKGRDLVLVVGSSVFPYYPYIAGPLLRLGHLANRQRSPKRLQHRGSHRRISSLNMTGV
jgi:hypothetical protein